MRSRDRFGLIPTIAVILLLGALLFAFAGHHHPLFTSTGDGDRMAAKGGMNDCVACTLERTASIPDDAEPTRIDLDSAPLTAVSPSFHSATSLDATPSRAPPVA